MGNFAYPAFGLNHWSRSMQHSQEGKQKAEVLARRMNRFQRQSFFPLWSTSATGIISETHAKGKAEAKLKKQRPFVKLMLLWRIIDA